MVASMAIMNMEAITDAMTSGRFDCEEADMAEINMPHRRSRQGSRDLLDVLTEEFRELRPGASCPAGTLVELYGAIHRLEQPRSALCLSGGGIRSACFALGVMQALARHQLLFSFDYLSTVSGGGYIGSWLSAWRHHAQDDQAVQAGLAARSVDPPDEPPNCRGCGPAAIF
jgi:hypothetical protein